jgi:hypothetical protein
MARPFSDRRQTGTRILRSYSSILPWCHVSKVPTKNHDRLETEGAAMSINWIAEMSRISADVSRHERVGTERISNQSRNIGERDSAVGIG